MLHLLLFSIPALFNSMHRFKFVVFVAKCSAISSRVAAILSLSAKIRQIMVHYRWLTETLQAQIV